LFLILESRSYCVSYYNFRGLGLQPYSFASNLDKYSTDFSRYAIPCIYESLILILEEKVIIQRILNKSLYSVLLLKANVQDIANRLLRECSRKPIGKN
jgi:hypothetical protein